MTFVADLAPSVLWRHFDEILTIPRGSKNEEAMRRYVLGVAERNGLEHRVDPAGNVVVRKPGTPGLERVPITVLQGHLDMVNEKNSDVEHDFDRDAIRPARDGDYLRAVGTTLGSDNGIGVAAMLALMDDSDVVHGPLELLFTVDEETGLTGAAQLGEDLLEGRRLINLDSEEEGVLTIGCAGGADTHLELPLTRQAASPGMTFLEVALAGLKGGHSGIDIHLQRGNAVRLLARALDAAGSAHEGFRLVRLDGGNKHNAIPREARATVAIPANEAAVWQRAAERELEAVGREYARTEPGLRWSVSGTAPVASTLDADCTRRVLALILALPHGVETMSRNIPGLVETSTNLAAVNERDGKLSVLMSTRSSVDSALAALRQRIRGAARLAGATVDERAGYPGWEPDTDSKLLGVVRRVHARECGAEPQVGAVHAGLECGIIGAKYSGMDMISFGPQIEFPHSPDERVEIGSVERFYRLLTATLVELSRS